MGFQVNLTFAACTLRGLKTTFALTINKQNDVSTLKIEILECYSVFYLVSKEELIRSTRTCGSIFHNKYLESASLKKRRGNYKLAVSS